MASSDITVDFSLRFVCHACGAELNCDGSCPRMRSTADRHKGEWHVTVDNECVGDWAEFCQRVTNKGFPIKALYIELNTFERQLMSASSWDPRACIDNENATRRYLKKPEFKVLRVKHELAPNWKGRSELPVTYGFPERLAVYYECHVKLDGTFAPSMIMSSRDLFRQHRWYVTKRHTTPFSPETFATLVKSSLERHGNASRVHSFEYEQCVLDTNEELDRNWK